MQRHRGELKHASLDKMKGALRLDLAFEVEERRQDRTLVSDGTMRNRWRGSA